MDDTEGVREEAGVDVVEDRRCSVDAKSNMSYCVEMEGRGEWGSGGVDTGDGGRSGLRTAMVREAIPTSRSTG